MDDVQKAPILRIYSVTIFSSVFVKMSQLSTSVHSARAYNKENGIPSVPYFPCGFLAAIIFTFSHNILKEISTFYLLH